MLPLIYTVCNPRPNSLLLNQGWFTFLPITIVSCKKSYGPILAHSRFCSACTWKGSGCSKAQVLEIPGKHIWSQVYFWQASGKTTKLFRGEKQKNDNWKDELKISHLLFRILELCYFLHFSECKIHCDNRLKNPIAYAQRIEKCQLGQKTEWLLKKEICQLYMCCL